MNSASRILAIYQDAMSSNAAPGDQFIKLWTNVLKLDDSDEDAITITLIALRNEIELVRTKLLDQGAPEDLFYDALTRFKNITSAALLHYEWLDHKRSLTNDVLVSLKWAAWTLPKEEDELTPEVLNALVSELDSLQESMAASTLSPYVKEFVARQISLIRTALRQYKIGGIAPVEEALEKTYGAVRRNTALLSKQVENASSDDKSLMIRFQTFLTKTADTADKVDKVRHGGEALMSIGKVLGEAFGGVVKLLT